MTLTAQRRPRSRPGATSRGFGYLIAISLNALFLYLVNVQPGWEAVPFLTPDTLQVLGLLHFFIAAGIAVNVAYLVYDAWQARGRMTSPRRGLGRDPAGLRRRPFHARAECAPPTAPGGMAGTGRSPE